MGRPTKNQEIAIEKRNKKLITMSGKGYPVDYLAAYFGLTKGRVSQIIKKGK